MPEPPVRQIDKLVATGKTMGTFYHSDGIGYCYCTIFGELDNYRVNSPIFRAGLRDRYLEKYKTLPTTRCLNTATYTLESIALYRGEER